MITTGALIGGAAISGLSNIVGNIFGKKSQDKANETNLKINQMNNDFNAREAEKAFLRESQYNDRIRAEDRAYNSAASQVERYRQAGLNPALMMQGQSAGMAQSNGVSSSAASAAPSSPQQAFRPDFGQLGSAIEGALTRLQQNDLMKEQVNGLRIENQFKAQKMMAEIANQYSDARSKDARAKLDRTLEGLQNNIFRMQYDEAQSRVLVNREQAKLIGTENLLKSKEVSTFAQKFGEESAIRLSQAALNAVSSDLTRNQAKAEIWKIIETQYRTQGIKINNDTAKRMADAIVEKAIKESRSFTLFGSDIGSGGHVLSRAWNNTIGNLFNCIYE